MGQELPPGEKETKGMIRSEEGNWLPIGPDTPTTDPALVNEIYEFCESYTPVSQQSRVIITTEIQPRQEGPEETERANLSEPTGDQ